MLIHAAQSNRMPVIRAIATLAILAGVIFAPVPFPFKVPLFALAAVVYVRMETGGFEAIGLTRPASQRSTLFWAVLAAALAIFGIGDIAAPAIEWALGIEPDYSGYGALEGNLPAALKLIGYAMFSAAIAEEIVYRGFLLHAFRSYLGSSRLAAAASVVIAAALFAFPHHAQGPVGLSMVFLTGVLFGVIYLRSGRNLYAVMLAHAMVDIWGVTNLYLGT